jgi:hypothetical protein
MRELAANDAPLIGCTQITETTEASIRARLID